MKLNSNSVLKILKVGTWIGFIGLCIKASSLLTSYLVSLFINSTASTNLYMGLDLSQLKEQSNTDYSILISCILLLFVLQAFLFFVLLQIFKYINIVSPFHDKIRKLFLNISGLSFAIGLVGKLTVEFSSRFISLGMSFPHLLEHIAIGDSFMFFGGFIFFISVLFKKGMELQTENDLTI